MYSPWYGQLLPYLLLSPWHSSSISTARRWAHCIGPQMSISTIQNREGDRLAVLGKANLFSVSFSTLQHCFHAWFRCVLVCIDNWPVAEPLDPHQPISQTIDQLIDPLMNWWIDWSIDRSIKAKLCGCVTCAFTACHCHLSHQVGTISWQHVSSGVQCELNHAMLPQTCNVKSGMQC